MNSSIKNIIFCGVGGQGVILASKVLMEAALIADYDLKESEVHGMAQRGGSVECNVRYGSEIFSPMIRKGSADFIVAFELLEAIRKIEFLKSDGFLIVNRLQIDPTPVQQGAMLYPTDIEQWLTKNVKNVIFVNTTEILKEINNPRVLNIVMLGILAKYLDFNEKQWESSIEKCVKEKFININKQAFRHGLNLNTN